MPKSTYYQLRLSPREKAKLARLAKERGPKVSIARMIRDDYGLGELTDSQPEGQGVAGPSGATGLVAHPASAPPAPDLPVGNNFVPSDKALTRLIKQLEAQGRPDPEGEARHRLGLQGTP